jgi:hypothetical protein
LAARTGAFAASILEKLKALDGGFSGAIEVDIKLTAFIARALAVPVFYPI